MIRFLTIAAAVAVAAHVTPAHAGSADAPSVAVEYRDLDLSAPEGRARLDARITAAARTLCAAHGNRDLSTLMAAKACYRAALASTRSQLAALATRQKRAAV